MFYIYLDSQEGKTKHLAWSSELDLANLKSTEEVLRKIGCSEETINGTDKKRWDIQFTISTSFVGTKAEALIKAQEDGDWLMEQVSWYGLMPKDCSVYFQGDFEGDE